jgi:hypothetical protein
LYPYFDFDNFQPLLLKEAQQAGDGLPELGDLGRVGGIHSKCGAAQFATAGSGGFELWHDAPAFRFDHCGGALRCLDALQQGRAGLRPRQRILKAVRC